uniref:5-hydroxytryptamine receptor 2B n=1 Tax=Pseudonaja textilis TaxID=8673 RepID=A0A670ZML3_PSETE
SLQTPTKILQTSTRLECKNVFASCKELQFLSWPLSLKGGPWPLPPYLCPAWLFLDVLFSTASIMHLCAISLDRYVAIKKPIQASQYNSRATTLIKIAVVWLISIGIAIPIPIRGIEENGADFQNFTCVLKPSRFGDFILYGSIAAFFVPLAIMVVSYFLTIRPPPRLTWNDRALPNGSEQMLVRRMSTVGKKSVQSITNEQRASKVLGIVFFLFLVMWCPFFITNITSVLCKSCSEEFIQMLMEIFVWIGYVSSGVNPLVYTLFNKTFREAFGRYITCNYQTSAAGRASRKPSARLSFRNSMTENSKIFMMHHDRSLNDCSKVQQKHTRTHTPAKGTYDLVVNVPMVVSTKKYFFGLLVVSGNGVGESSAFLKCFR